MITTAAATTTTAAAAAAAAAAVAAAAAATTTTTTATTTTTTITTTAAAAAAAAAVAAAAAATTTTTTATTTTTTITTTTTTIIILIIAFEGAIRDFLQSPHKAANCFQHARSSGPGATVCKSRATHRALITCKCHVMCHLVRRDSSSIKFDRVEIAFIRAYFVGGIIKPMKEGRKPECPEKNPGDKLQKMSHTTARSFKPQARLEPAQ